MKSYLIDALRHADNPAGDDDSVNRHPDTAGESLREVGNPAGPDAPGLDALELEDLPVDKSPIEPESLDADTKSTGEASPAGDTDIAFSATVAPSESATPFSGRKSKFATVGRLAPVLCLISMSAAAGGYVLLNQLASNNLNGDLTGLSQRFQSDMRAEAGQDGSQELPATGISVIHKVSEPGGISVASSTVQGRESATPESTASAGSPPAAGQRIPEERDSVRIGVTRNVLSAVNDQAYSAVLAAFNAYRAQDFELAEEHYEQALAIEPNHIDALEGLGAVYRQTGRDAEAAVIYQKLLSIDTRNTVAAAAIISLRSKEAGWNIESDLKHLLQRYPDADHLHYSLGSYFADEGRWADARYEFLAAHQLDPRNPDYSYNVAVSLANLGEFLEARSYFELALETVEYSSNLDADVISRHLGELMVHSRDRS